MKKVILAVLLVISSFKAFAGFTSITAASISKNMIKFPGSNLSVIQKLEGNSHQDGIGEVKTQLLLIEQNVAVKNSTQTVRSVLLGTSDGVNSYYFKIADGKLIKNLTSIKQGSGSIIEIDLELMNGKTTEINVMLMSTEREDQTGENKLQVFHAINIMDKFGYKRK